MKSKYAAAISVMDGQELIDFSADLGAPANETFEESSRRYRDEGDDETAAIFSDLAERWHEIEQE